MLNTCHRLEEVKPSQKETSWCLSKTVLYQHLLLWLSGQQTRQLELVSAANERWRSVPDKYTSLLILACLQYITWAFMSSNIIIYRPIYCVSANINISPKNQSDPIVDPIVSVTNIIL